VRIFALHLSASPLISQPAPQLAVVEFTRNVLRREAANSTEFDQVLFLHLCGKSSFRCN